MQQIDINQDPVEVRDALTVGSRSYTLHIEGDAAPLPDDDQHIITVRSAEEVVRYQILLGDSCSLSVSPGYSRAHPDLASRIQEFAIALRSQATPLHTKVAAEMMRKLPFDLKGLLKSPIALVNGDTASPSIDKALVHKKNDANVLISKPFIRGRLRYFNMFLKTEELRFDHSSEHVQGLLMLEALRQASIATAHLQGLPLDGMLALMEYSTNFLSFLETGAPIVIRSYSCFSADASSKDKEASIFLQVIQWGRICAEAQLKAYACMNGNNYRQQEKRIDKITARHKTLFESKLTRMLEPEKAY